MKSVFKYPDTNASRSGIDFLNDIFKNEVIGIVGLGGTGSYILDLVSKTPVKAIHLFDDDILQVHNAFRAPSAVNGSVLDKAKKKVNYYSELYSNIHMGIIPHAMLVNEGTIHELQKCSIVFLSVDDNKSRSFIITKLLDWGIPVIDVGLGVNISEDSLVGTVRATTVTKDKNHHIFKRIGSAEIDENDYKSNIQIADLNCLNAVFAVIRWKKMIGFYRSDKEEFNSLYCLTTNKLLNEDY